jgi:purine-nucleoside phosphorylase
MSCGGAFFLFGLLRIDRVKAIIFKVARSRRSQVSIHIGAEKGQIAPAVLLAGDPLRAKYFAETLLQDVTCFNEVRGMLGFTGTHHGKRISIMGTGMGMPSLAIYLHELINEYDARTLIRVGTCGALQPGLEIGDIVLAMSSSTNSNMNRRYFGGLDFAPTASFDLLLKAHQAAAQRGISVRAGGIFSSDTFYGDDPDWWKKWAAHGALVCEMETSCLYTLAARFDVSALSVLTVSDSLVTGAAATAEQRERAFPRMAEIALAAIA